MSDGWPGRSAALTRGVVFAVVLMVGVIVVVSLKG